MRLTPELQRWKDVIENEARSRGLDFFETIFEVLSYDELNEVAAFGGFPTRYPHWRFGMEYERLSKGFEYGLHRIYELVINNDPCYAYLLSSNPIVDQKMVMAHVYGHCDFFKNNYWFSFTNRKMMDEMANHATKVRRLIDQVGLEKVEDFIDVALSIENLIDHMSPYVRRAGPSRTPVVDDEHAPVQPRKIRAKDYMEHYINPPEFMQRQRERLEAEKERKQRATPDPVRDVFSFLIENAPLRPWQIEIMEIVRAEAYYFNPQAMTKIMNEGWATYWHRRIMVEKVLADSEVVDYAETMSGTLASSGPSLNPYQLGLALWEDIEYRYDTGRWGLEWARCEDAAARKIWDTGAKAGRAKIFEVRRHMNDVGFIDEFLTEEFCHQQKLFIYAMNPRTGRREIVTRDFPSVKRELLRMLTNGGHPIIDAVDANFGNRGELLLVHRWEESDLRDDYARETLRNIWKVWGRPVKLRTTQSDKAVLYICDDGNTRLEDA